MRLIRNGYDFADVEAMLDEPQRTSRRATATRWTPSVRVKETVALARQYAEMGYAAEAYFARLAEIACRDDFTEMHALKHYQAIVDYATGRASPLRLG